MHSSIRQTFAGALLLGAATLSLAASGDALAQGYPPPQNYPQPGYSGESQPAPPPNPMCARLEAQLASLDRGGGDPAKADQIRRFEDAAAKQQAELDRITTKAKRMGCDSSGFFSLFNNQSADCGPVNNQIQQMRANLDQITSNLERLRVGGGVSERDNQRRSVLLALAQNNCGPQYAAAARSGGTFIDNLFNNGNGGAPLPPPAEAGTPSGTYRTVCVRSCDGYYFPISFATVPARFPEDERSCKSLCPAAEATLFTYRNPGEDINHAVSLTGQSYTSQPNAFRYRQEYNASCQCKAAGQTWSDALKAIDDKASIEQGDIIVTEERAKKMSQPLSRPAPQKKDAAATPAAGSTAAGSADDGNGNKQIRSVGPTFIPAR